MSEPNSTSDQIPPVPPAPSFTYGSPEKPAAPAAPPAPAAPEAAPVAPEAPPAYGERVPGYVPPVAPPAPGYAVPPAPGYPQPVYGQPGYGAAGYGMPPARRRRTWDVVLTIILFVMGLFGMIAGLFYAWIFANPALFAEAMAQQGMALGVDTRGAATIIGISHPVLYLLGLGIGILLLVKNKIAFWVPLTAGVIATIIFWGTFVAIVMSDPGFLNSVY